MDHTTSFVWLATMFSAEQYPLCGKSTYHILPHALNSWGISVLRPRLNCKVKESVKSFSEPIKSQAFFCEHG